jgi:hypothetical protein
MATYEAADFVAQVSSDGIVQRQSFGETTVVVRYLAEQVPVRLAFVEGHEPFVWSATVADNDIDRHIDAKLKLLGINATARSSDTTFVRRAYLDLLGILPTSERAIAFVNDPSPTKRHELIDELLNRPEFADHWALHWCDLLRVEEKLLDEVGTEAFHGWIRRWVAAGRPMNEFARELVAAAGSTYQNPPTNLYRALRDPLARGETIARVFLGYRLECAKCHNHPFDQWTQDDYYSWAACFSQVDYEIIENKVRDKFDKSEFIGEQIVKRKLDAQVDNPRTRKPAAPQVLGRSEPAIASDGQTDRLAPLADWLAAHDHRQLAATMVNRVWFHLMGRGLVDPVDDFRVTNPPSHPELLELLTSRFIEADFDLRTIIRWIMQSRAYQTASAADACDDVALNNYAANRIRRLTAEQLVDARSQVLGIPVEFNGYRLGLRASQIPGVKKVRLRDSRPSAGDRFLTIFGKPQRLLACECERSDEPTLNQAFLLISDESLQRQIDAGASRVTQLASSVSFDVAMTELYWSALSRPPTTDEIDQARQLAAATGDPTSILQDVAWALLNSKEFLFRY